MTAKYKTPFLVIGGLFVIWGILGLVDMGREQHGDPGR
jgi:hypothetical protein